MNEILKYYLKSLSNSTLTLKKKGILVEKPWALLDNNGEIQKLIFKSNGRLILSKNGQVTEGSWEYLAEAKSLLINRVTDKLLLNEQFIDENVLIFKRDGTNSDFFAFTNELTLPDYNIPKYLNGLKCQQFKIKQVRLLTGNVLQVYNGSDVGSYTYFTNHKVEQIDVNYQNMDLNDGTYFTLSKSHIFYIANSKIFDIKPTYQKAISSEGKIEIEDGTNCLVSNRSFLKNINKKVSINGLPLANQRLQDWENVIYEIRESIITNILFQKTYELYDGRKITIEQKDYSNINKGDKILKVEPNSSSPNDSYKIKGKFFKIKAINNVIV